MVEKMNQIIVHKHFSTELTYQFNFFLTFFQPQRVQTNTVWHGRKQTPKYFSAENFSVVLHTDSYFNNFNDFL